MVIELILAVFLEKLTSKTSANWFKSMGQV